MTSNTAQVNGETTPQEQTINSLFLEHLLTYPLVKDGVTTIQSNQLGQKSIQIGDTAYRRLAGPVIPYLSRPYQYVSPYLEKADAIGEETLKRVDERFPAIKKPTGELYADAKNLVLLPYQKGLEGKQRVLDIYSDECRKLSGKDNFVMYGKAAVGTAFAIGGQTFNWVNSYLAAKKEDAKSAVNEKANN
jgi:hypothetical protein